ncbi:hypothetical protein FGA82_15275 [Pseudomonas fluorescens]|uniref:hypothetical protein n=1 Tax=Pseudomonas fluorescens TaxID=294 RepID=UPI0011325AD0|nr:hypothetical protein [Pseudomonas fluorescens]TMU78601.1 hypothetical protein FGA82_15275 [Pseudomonas fluorescens]
MSSMITIKDGYFSFYRENILKFTANRFFPYISMSIIGILLANKNIDEFAFFSYIAAAFIFPATIATFMFMAIGNLTSRHPNHGIQEIFISSFLIAAISATFVICACVTIIYFSSEEVQTLPLHYRATALEFTYLTYIAVYIFTSFFNSFFEAHIKDKTSSKARLINFVPLITSATLIFLIAPAENSSLAIVRLMLVCAVIEFAYYLYISLKRDLWSGHVQPDLCLQLFKLGAPTGIGLSLQRLAFFIVNKKLFLVDRDLVSIFSIAISVVTLMTIPVSAFTQIHSIYITKKPGSKLNIDAFILLTASMVMPLMLFAGFGHSILMIFGVSNDMQAGNTYLTESITSMFLATGLLMLISSHIRALGNTVIPQIVINAAIYLIYVGSVFYQGVESKTAFSLLSTYSASYFVCFLLLAMYVVHIERKSTTALGSSA